MADCGSCPSNGECTADKASCQIVNNPLNNVKKIIAVMSGKGGVGKSTMSVLIAHELRRRGNTVGVLDADITGPSIPRLLHVQGEKPGYVDEHNMSPVVTDQGIKVMSLNLLIENEADPVVWRGPVLSGAVKQFWNDVVWGDLDYLVIDMPPGTGDVGITALQSIPINGIVMVSMPQDFVSMIVSKAVKMAEMLDKKVLGVIQNMSYIKCPDCGSEIKLHTGEMDSTLDIDILGDLPMCREIIDISTKGIGEDNKIINELMTPVVDNILKKL